MMRTVRLEMARCHDFPEGSTAHGYELHLPLTRARKLDLDFWMKHRPDAGFRRFWGEEEKLGQLRHDRKGWILSFEPGGDTDEVFFRGDDHRFAVGEYVSIEEHDGQTRTFRVVTVH